MKYIRKQHEPALFARWKSNNPGATYKADLCNIHNAAALAAKAALKASLLSEQKYICCYCESRVSASNSHIEHFRPKGNPAFAHLQLDYGNLFASCTKEPTGNADEHCGHKKGDFFSTDLVSPLEPDCSSHFNYNMDGTIHGSDPRGVVTVEKLHLDSALLNGQRKSLIDNFLDIDDDAELQEEIAQHLDESVTLLDDNILRYVTRSKD